MRPPTGDPPDAAGRRQERSDRRNRILTAALEVFAAKGHSGTTLREIALRAGVDPALIHYFFADKDALFRQAVSSRIDLSALFDDPADGKPEAGHTGPGQRLARAVLTVWEDESTRPALVAVHRTGLSDGPIAAALRHRVDAALASCLHRTAPEGVRRSPMSVSLLSAHLTGLVMLRYVFPAEPLASLDFETLTDVLARAVDTHGARHEEPTAHPEYGTGYSCH